MEDLNAVINAINGILFSNYTVYALLAVGILFTVWSGFGQYRALTHGVAVVRGKYDDKNDPGAINHFQALSAALSATVGLGNIAGVAVAVALGGPGAVLWMWVIGLLGMSLKMTEVTQSMLYRNTDDPENPHGGPMFVVKKGFQRWGLGGIGSLIGGVFVVTLLISAITGGNMFQAWSVADITKTYFDVPQVVSGIILAVVVGLVIIGGIKRIGSVAGRIVPFMCVIYVLAALLVLAINIAEVPAMLALIVKSGLPPFLGGEAPDATGAFLGGTFGYAAMWGVKRALFSSEAGQGSSPIAHSAAKTDEPVREGVVAGLEPFIDTIVVCTLTALVILSSGAYSRGSEADFASPESVRITFASEVAGELGSAPAASKDDENLTFEEVSAPTRVLTKSDVEKKAEAEKKGKEFDGDWDSGDRVYAYAAVQPGDRRIPVSGKLVKADGSFTIRFDPIKPEDDEDQLQSASLETTLYHGALPSWTLKTPTLPNLNSDAKRIRRTAEGDAGWRSDETLFMIMRADADSNTGRDLRKLTGTAKQVSVPASAIQLEPLAEDAADDLPDVTVGESSAIEEATAVGAFELTHREVDGSSAIVITHDGQVGERIRVTTPLGDVVVVAGEEGLQTEMPAELSVNAKSDDDVPDGAIVITATNDDWPKHWISEWGVLESAIQPRLKEVEEGKPDLGIYADYAGASLTAYAFDRTVPGLGMIIVSIAAWLFAISTMISWNYYGEQGVHYLFAKAGSKTTTSAVLVYKVIYCSLILLTTIAAMPIIEQENGTYKPLIGTDTELDMWTTLGLGVMLVANIPIMLIFSAQAMKAYREYFKRMDAGEDQPHDAPPLTDVVEGKDVE